MKIILGIIITLGVIFETYGEFKPISWKQLSWSSCGAAATMIMLTEKKIIAEPSYELELKIYEDVSLPVKLILELAKADDNFDAPLFSRFLIEIGAVLLPKSLGHKYIVDEYAPFYGFSLPCKIVDKIREFKLSANIINVNGLFEQIKDDYQDDPFLRKNIEIFDTQCMSEAIKDKPAEKILKGMDESNHYTIALVGNYNHNFSITSLHYVLIRKALSSSDNKSSFNLFDPSNGKNKELAYDEILDFLSGEGDFLDHYLFLGMVIYVKD